MQVGLEKLEFTEQQVAVMQTELKALQPSLIQTVAETDELMAQVSREKAEVVEPKKAVVDAEVAKAEEAAAAANAIKVDCEAALAVAMPVLESALCALSLFCHHDNDGMRIGHREATVVGRQRPQGSDAYCFSDARVVDVPMAVTAVRLCKYIFTVCGIPSGRERSGGVFCATWVAVSLWQARSSDAIQWIRAKPLVLIAVEIVWANDVSTASPWHQAHCRICATCALALLGI